MKELTLEEVKIYVLEHFCEYLPECYQKSTLRVESAVKNNQRLTGIGLADVEISPTIYLEHIYEEYLEHKEVKFLYDVTKHHHGGGNRNVYIPECRCRK